MSKILILTFHWTDNYGGVLQNYALFTVLKGLNNDVKVLDYYNPNQISKKYSVVSRIKHKCWEIAKGPFGYWRRHRKTCHFKQQNLIFTDKPIHTYDLLQDKFENYDYIFVGSDQVWNFLITNDPKAYLLSFAKKPFKISYGASFGVDYVSDEYAHFLKEELPFFNRISVRDDFSKSIVDSYLCSKKSEIVLDPTLLITKEQWFSIINKRKANKRRYVLCYYMPNSNQRLMELLKKFSSYLAKKYHLKIINIGKKEYEVLKFWENNYTSAGPLDFLDLIKNATFIVTNSFHGTVFSINFNKQFFVCLDKTATSNNSTLRKRIEHILDSLSLSDRIVNCGDTFENKDVSDIDYSKANVSLTKMRKESMEFLDSCFALKKEK